MALKLVTEGKWLYADCTVDQLVQFSWSTIDRHWWPEGREFLPGNVYLVSPTSGRAGGQGLLDDRGKPRIDLLLGEIPNCSERVPHQFMTYLALRPLECAGFWWKPGTTRVELYARRDGEVFRLACLLHPGQPTCPYAAQFEKLGVTWRAAA